VAGKKMKWFVIVGSIFAVVAGLWIAAFSLAGDSFGGGADFFAEFDEETVTDGDSDEKIVLINVVGEIFSDPDESFQGPSDTNIIAQLQQVIDDEAVTGVIIHLETPGGGVVASDTIYRKVREVAGKRHDIPVVALMGDTAASGGYYIAAGANEIVAHPSTWTGSIGVIAMLPNVEKVADKIGVGVTVLKSGPFKDAGSPFRAMTPEEQGLFQALVDEAYGEFVNVVAKGRKLDPAKARQLADGRIYSGTQAKQAGLVDHLGGRDVAFRRAKDLAESPGASLVRYVPKTGIEDLFNIGAGVLSPAEVLEKSIGIRRHPGVAYLWLP